MRRMLQWSSILMSLLLIPIAVHGFIDEQGLHKMTLELVHRNDPRLVGITKSQSNSINNKLETIKGFMHRDSLRHQRLNQRWGLRENHSHRRKNWETFQMPMHSGRDYGVGEYFVHVEAGTPGQKFWLVADTGSELTWFNCRNRPHRTRGGAHKHRTRPRPGSTRPRTRSKHRTRSNPCKGVFCPQRSRSFQTVTCSSSKCKIDLSELFSLTYCPKPSDPCLYDISYVDGSSAKGFFGTETITVNLTNGKKGKLHNVTIGCTKSIHDGGSFTENTGGILGLGYANVSFVDKASLEFGSKFSYCLVDHLSHQNISSYLTFGTPNVTLLSEIKRAELVVVPPFYGVKVVGISIGGEMLKIPHEVWDFSAQGGTILDSGTTLTALAPQAYEPVIEALNKSLTKFKRVREDFGVLDYCFDANGFDESEVPRLAFHFSGGTRFEPPVKSYVIDAAPQVKCIGVTATNGPAAASVIGNIMQQNHLWEFDLAQNTVGFAPSTCKS